MNESEQNPSLRPASMDDLPSGRILGIKGHCELWTNQAPDGQISLYFALLKEYDREAYTILTGPGGKYPMLKAKHGIHLFFPGLDSAARQPEEITINPDTGEYNSTSNLYSIVKAPLFVGPDGGIFVGGQEGTHELSEYIGFTEPKKQKFADALSRIIGSVIGKLTSPRLY